jgi:mono/diheme cytochrome c family protein
MYGKLNLLLVAGIGLCLGSLYMLARDPREPNYELIPERQMGRSPAFGSYAPNPNFADGITFRPAAPHTIARGSQPFPYEPTPTDAARAGKELTNPLALSDAAAREQGAFFYGAYCQYCHGRTGMGDGPVSGRGFPAPLSFLKSQAMDMRDGEMFHILTYGKGNMPAQAAQLAPADRWAVILHVRVLQNKYTEVPPVRLADMVVLYKAHCAACHAEDGSGSLVRAKLPSLPDFSSMAWQLSKTTLEITNRIEYGDEPLMPSFRYRMTRDQILGLSIYLRSLAMKESKPGTPPHAAPPATAAGMTPVQIFRAYCLACHNVDGRGAIVRPGMPDIPDFTLATWQASKPDADLSKSILSGGKFMPAMKDRLTQADADTMVKFIRQFQDGKQVVALESPAVPKPPEPVVQDVPKGEEKPPVVAKEPTPVKPTPPSTAPDVAERLRSAGVLFREYCIVCHGTDGAGVAAMRVAMPALPDFTRVTFRDQHSNPQLLVSILDGKGTLMPANRGRINEAQARDLVAYIRAFAPAQVGVTSLPPDEFQQQFDQLQRQWEALERDLQLLRKAPAGPPPEK